MFSILIALQKTYKILLKILWQTVTSQFKNITISCTNTECEWILITGSYHTSLLQSKKPKNIQKTNKWKNSIQDTGNFDRISAT